MSFGFSVSDIYGCARLAYVLYNEFKQAPGACQDFAKELLLFHQVLLKTKSNIEADISHINNDDKIALETCFDSCKELLYVQIVGAATVPRILDKPTFRGSIPSGNFGLSTPNEKNLLRGLRQKLEERKFASRIPTLLRAISAHIEKLTALNVLIVQSSQRGIQASQKRIEESIGESRDLLTKSSDNHVLQVESLSDRLETSQSRIEAQLQAILKNQQRTRTPILSQSLDASSPEGRQTWMELGRLLRDEGVTPAMIRENRELLVNAMKSTLKAESVLESYVTAPEHKLNSYPLSITESRNSSHQDFASAFSSISLFGSGPPRSTSFTDAFLERQSSAPGSLNQKQNVDNGMRSLLQGMDGGDSRVGNENDGMDDVDLEDVELENLGLERGYGGGVDSLNKGPRQQRAVNHVMQPLVPTSKRRESSRNLEWEIAGAFAEAPTGVTSVPIEWGPVKEYSYQSNTQRPAPGTLDARTASDDVISTELITPFINCVWVEESSWESAYKDPATYYQRRDQDMAYKNRQRVNEYERESGCI